MNRYLHADFSMVAPMLYMPADRPNLAAVLGSQRSRGVCYIAGRLEDAVWPNNRKNPAAALCATIEQIEELSGRFTSAQRTATPSTGYSNTFRWGKSRVHPSQSYCLAHPCLDTTKLRPAPDPSYS